ncbi:MAG: hypothetical protein HOC77_10905, partial [Chloroflexi bacterium]|nr:hypothetical protein [Chloroflexota bacterium]
MPADTQSRYRLPKTIVPSRYDITLEPDLQAYTFAGSEAIDIAVSESVDEMVINSIEIEIDEAWLSAADGSRTDVSGITYDEELQRATLSLASSVNAGDYVL